MDRTPDSLYDAAGGAETLFALVDHFYEHVAADALLAPLFPADFGEIRSKQKAFLTQFFGGPALYAQQYGAPMMRHRHMRFSIAPAHANAWLSCMSQAMDEVGLEGPLRRVMFERLTLTARHMVNTPPAQTDDEPHNGATPDPFAAPPLPLQVRGAIDINDASENPPDQELRTKSGHPTRPPQNL